MPLYKRLPMRIFLLGIIACLILVAPAMAHEGHVHGKPDTAQNETQADTPTPSGYAIETVVEAEPAEPEPQPEPTFGALLQNLHPATTHFPIGLLIAAALAQALASARKSERLADAAGIMAIAGGIGAVVTAAFGWIHTGLWFGGDNVMHWHRWLGTGLGVAGALIAVAATKRETHPVPYRALLYLCAAVLLVQGYLGGEISHGAGHLWRSFH